MRSLPLFHRITGQPVIVLGKGEPAEAKRRLVERAGGEVIGDMQEGIAKAARLAFIAYDDGEDCEAAAIRLRCAGVLVNVVDRPELCDFTTPSILERDPVLLAIGTSGASAGLAKQLRLRLERLLPGNLGELADRLHEAREMLRRKFPVAAARRQALDRALGEGGPLDPLREGAAERVTAWLGDAGYVAGSGLVELVITSDDPENLTLRQARLLGSADAIVADPGIAPAILDRARADARRLAPPVPDPPPAGLVLRLLRA